MVLSCLPNVSKNIIMKQDQINSLHNIRKECWVLLVRVLCHIMYQIRPKTENLFANNFEFFLFLLILYLPTVSNKFYHDIGSDQVSAQHKLVFLSVTWENVMSYHWSDTAETGNHIAFVLVSILAFPHIMSSYCFKQILTWHSIRIIACKTHSRTGECCLEEIYVSSWRRHGLKWGMSWIFFVFLNS